MFESLNKSICLRLLRLFYPRRHTVNTVNPCWDRSGGDHRVNRGEIAAVARNDSALVVTAAPVYS